MERRDWIDVGFTVLIKPGEYLVGYKMHKIAGESDDGLLWDLNDSTVGYTEDLALADLFASGWVKWNGCSDWRFDTQDRCMIHGCSREDLSRIGEALSRCWDATKEVLPAWDSTIA